jgi:hypothetical protein
MNRKSQSRTQSSRSLSKIARAVSCPGGKFVTGVLANRSPQIDEIRSAARARKQPKAAALVSLPLTRPDNLIRSDWSVGPTPQPLRPRARSTCASSRDCYLHARATSGRSG